MDGDAGDNAAVRYSLLPGPHNANFRLHPETGFLYPAKRVSPGQQGKTTPPDRVPLPGQMSYLSGQWGTMTLLGFVLAANLWNGDLGLVCFIAMFYRYDVLKA